MRSLNHHLLMVGHLYECHTRVVLTYGCEGETGTLFGVTEKPLGCAVTVLLASSVLCCAI